MNTEIKELKEYYHVTKSHDKRVSDFKGLLLTTNNPAEAIELHSAMLGLYLAFNISLKKAIELVYEFTQGERVLILNMTPIASKDCIIYLKHKIPLFFKNNVGCYDEEKNVFINGPIEYPFFGLTQKYYSNKSISDSTLLMEAIPMVIETCEYFNIGYKELIDLYKKSSMIEDGIIDSVVAVQNIENNKLKDNTDVTEESKKDELKELLNNNGITYEYISEKHYPHGNFTISAEEFAKIHKIGNDYHDYTLGIDIINYGHTAQMVGGYMINEYIVSVTANGINYGQDPFPFKDLDKLKLPYFVKLNFTPGPTYNAITVSVRDKVIGSIKTNDSQIPNKVSFEQLNSFSKMLNDINKMVVDYLVKEQVSKPIIYSF